MVATRLRRVGVLGCCLLVPVVSSAATTNATVTNGNVQLRESYPTFSTSTLWQFQLNAGPVVRNIPKDSRVEVTAKRTIKTQEWFAVTYVVGENKFKGWVYAGEVGDRRYLRLDKGVEEHLPVAVGLRDPAPAGATVDAALALLLPTAYAQDEHAVAAPPLATSPVATLLVNFAHVVIFLGALLFTKKFIFKASYKYCFLTPLCVLLMFGYLSSTTFADLIAKLLA